MYNIKYIFNCWVVCSFAGLIFFIINFKTIAFSMNPSNKKTNDFEMKSQPQGKVVVEKVEYKGWPNCYRVSNGIIELIVTTDVGPRIIQFGFVGKDNEFMEYKEALGKTGGNEWRNYGGHRLWHAPEAVPRTYFPDNVPVKFEQHEGFMRVIQPVETTTGIQKELDIRMSPEKPLVEITHRLHNTNLWSVELSAWALSVMAPGGVAIFPLPPRGSHPKDLLPTSSIAIWAYTDMKDPRWTWGEKYILLRQDPNAKYPQKAGFHVKDGWAAYARNGNLFVKRFKHIDNVFYPDFGSSAETFTNADMIELETLSPLSTIKPGESIQHVERWYLFRDVPPPRNDSDVDGYVLPKVKETEAIE